MAIDFLLNGYILEKLTYYKWEDCTSNIKAVFYRQSKYLLEIYFLFFYSSTHPGYHTKRDTIIVIHSIFQMINEINVSF